ncbi:hypothetical protein AEP_01708 [Curvibacter sp. AEP1-3]|uniref:hypothetical protein n=1 Tax=Curvibacter sp. AEP1-3 TaxID=1844971 RepID=UPI000B3BED9C|nr:hypothetical protein [Curvibacter sp. AEP1-3]ARV18652.1 hypothetical protein AEP_01708 [Curvibacter sp. AEP1-3]
MLLIAVLISAAPPLGQGSAQFNRPTNSAISVSSSLARSTHWKWRDAKVIAFQISAKVELQPLKVDWDPTLTPNLLAFVASRQKETSGVIPTVLPDSEFRQHFN